MSSRKFSDFDLTENIEELDEGFIVGYSDSNNIRVPFKLIYDKLSSNNLTDELKLQYDNYAEEISDLGIQTESNLSAINELRTDIINAEHFKGYVLTPEDLDKILNADQNDFAYVASTETKWIYNDEQWIDTELHVPDKITPLSDLTPRVDGEATAGESSEAARADHIHPTDNSLKISKVSELENDSGFITTDDLPEIPEIDLSNYATTNYVDDKFAEIETITGEQGADGKSAYEIAVENGFVGTEQDWLDSLNGKNGLDGSNGFSPEITVKAQTDSEYILNITTSTGIITTPNLQGKDGKDGSGSGSGTGDYDITSGLFVLYINDDGNLVYTYDDKSDLPNMYINEQGELIWSA